jgi:hypothetical protein
MQSEAPVQLTTVPPKPTCNPSAIFASTDCTDRWNIYNQAVQQRQREELQLYVNRQKDLASAQATAPLQQQIADLKKLTADQQGQIKKLNEQMQADTATALQAKSAAHTEGLQQGTSIGVGATLLLFGVVFGIRRLTRNFSITKKPQARAASAE